MAAITIAVLYSPLPILAPCIVRRYVPGIRPRVETIKKVVRFMPVRPKM